MWDTTKDRPTELIYFCLRVKTETEIADEGQDSDKEVDTIPKYQITNLRILMRKAREHQQPLYICFVDFKNLTKRHSTRSPVISCL